MPEYRRDASAADWIYRPSWKAVRSDLNRLLREGTDCQAFKVRGGHKEGDENRADLHPRTRDVFRAGTDDPPRPAAADETAADDAAKGLQDALDNGAQATDQGTRVDATTAAGAHPAVQAPQRDTRSHGRVHPDPNPELRSPGAPLADVRPETRGTGNRDTLPHDERRPPYPQVQAPSAPLADVRPETGPTGSHDIRRHHEKRPSAPATADHEDREQGGRWEWWVESVAIALLFVAERWRAATFLVVVLAVGFQWIRGGDAVRPFNGPRDDGTATTMESEEDPASARAAEAALNLDGAARRRIQESLERAGVNPGPADGVFGARTRAAIRQWQGSRGAPETGYLSGADVTLLIGEGGDEQEGVDAGPR